jgi:hypothetical protein
MKLLLLLPLLIGCGETKVEYRPAFEVGEPVCVKYSDTQCGYVIESEDYVYMFKTSHGEEVWAEEHLLESMR